MEKRTSPVKEEERHVVPAAAGDTEGGEIGKFGHKLRVANRDFAKPTSPADDQIQQDDELKSTRAEVGEAREENERLKKVLTRIVKDYQALQMHFFDIVQQEPPPANKTPSELRAVDDNVTIPDVELEPELVSLRLGTSATSGAGGVHEKEEKRAGKGDPRVDDDDHEGLTLGLDVSKFGSSASHAAAAAAAATEPSPPSLSSDNSSEEAKEQEAAGDQPWPPGKAAAKNLRSEDQEEVTPPAQVKRARVSVRARCDTPTMNDGCQWRKYGQKVSKGNPCPRAYYRCTVAPLCPVRKQVQRCAEDMSILITTYEGTHNHPLPIAATAMASTTSAAACMLTSGSTSAPRLSGISAPSSSTTAYINPHGPSHFYLQNQLISPSSNSHPTITLDLTNKYNSSNFAPSAPRYPPAPTTFNFSSSIESNSMPSWTSACSSTSSQPQPYNNKSTAHMYSSLNQAYWQRAATSALPPPAPNNMSTDTIARAITSDPSFQSALAAAITSYVGARSNDAGANGASNYGSSRYLNRGASLGSASQGGLMLLQPPMPVVVSGPKSASGSPEDDMEQAD